MTTASRVDVPTTAGDMPAHLWLPEAGSGPGILLLQEIFGISRYVEQRASDLAGLGYVVLAPEIFWRLGVSKVPEGPDMLEEAMGLLPRLDWDAAVDDAAAALGHLRGLGSVTGPVGALGFCFGGGLGFALAAREPVDALVSYYGSALPDLLGLSPQVTAPSLHQFGLADSYIPADTVARIEDAVAGPEVEFCTYEGADHAFDNPDLPMHHPEASEQAWAATERFLATRLPVGPAGG
ncbi:dienelactone hydrolase family protein [Nocardioides nanhaiensis]|uniref:Dienelactone hydrolase family protein n=1 Tax=Nocardioides nanhaiensis TaxID=1476871 RepID=A0ABP8WM56_9ACTN